MRTLPLCVACVLLVMSGHSGANEADDRRPAMAFEKQSRPVFSSAAQGKLAWSSGVRSILHDSSGNYWFGGNQEGVARFDGQTFTYFTIEQGLSSNQVRSIHEDSRGRIFLDTANGVNSIDGDRIAVHREPAFSAFAFADAGHPPRSVPSELWFGAGTKTGFYAFDGSRLRFVGFPISDRQSFNDHLFTVTDISKGDGAHASVATFSAVFRYSDESIKVFDDAFFGFDDDSETLHVRSVLEDSRGRLWIGNNGIGVLLIDGEESINFSREHGLIHPESKGKGDRSPPGTLEHVFAMAEDKHGAIWFGDRDTGAWRFDNESMTHFTVDSALPSQQIWSIYQDANGELLFAMGEGGVYVFNGNGFDRRF